MKDFRFSISSRPTMGPIQPSIQLIQESFSLEVKWPGREIDHLTPTSVQVKKTWIYTSNPPYVFTV
jgi:hypothetical protein